MLLAVKRFSLSGCRIARKISISVNISILTSTTRCFGCTQHPQDQDHEHEKEAWIRSSEGIIDVYRKVITVKLEKRTPAREFSPRKYYLFLNTIGEGGDGDKNGIFIFSRMQFGPPLDTKCKVAFEIMRNGQPHPYRFAQTAKLLAFNHVLPAHSLAVALEWTEGHSQKKMYLPRKVNTLVDNNLPGSWQALSQSLGIIAWLRRVPLDYFSWSFRVRTHDHVRDSDLNQHLPNMTKRIEAPTQREQADIEQELRNFGLDKIGGEFRKWKTGSHRANGATTCDCCYVMNKEILQATGRRTQKNSCHQVPGTQTCKHCNMAGLPCTWTATETIEANDRAIYRKIKEQLLAPGRWAEHVGLAQRHVTVMDSEDERYRWNWNWQET